MNHEDLRITVFDPVNDVLLIELNDSAEWGQISLRPLLMARWLESGLRPPLLILDHSGKQEISHRDLNALLNFRKIVTDRGGEMCLCGVDAEALEKSPIGAFFPIANSRQEAAERLLPIRQLSEVEREKLAAASEHTLDGVVFGLVGCPVRDVGDVPERLRSAGIEFRLPGTVADGDYVVFCISCTDSLSAGTRQSVARCAGRTIRPLAIVLTDYQLVDNESLRDLVTAEETELLSQVVPRAVAERLPLYYDFDPGLPAKLKALIRNGIEAVTCGR